MFFLEIGVRWNLKFGEMTLIVNYSRSLSNQQPELRQCAAKSSTFRFTIGNECIGNRGRIEGFETRRLLLLFFWEWEKERCRGQTRLELSGFLSIFEADHRANIWTPVRGCLMTMSQILTAHWHHTGWMTGRAFQDYLSSPRLPSSFSPSHTKH